ncbi:MAG: site-2 protease family protein, partial [Myxococcales bacterium]
MCTCAWGVRRKVGRYHQFIRARATRANQPPPPPLPVDVEVDAWLSQREQRERALPRTARLWLLGATLLASAVSFTPLVSGRDLAAIIGALLFHELGHWTAMRACGYRDTGIFFIPLFGAVTTGRNDSATPAQRLLVLLAGPVPGLVLGAALLATTSDEDVFRIASMFVGINAFNLLPLVPLDGGQVVNLLFVGRHPWLSAGFHLLATAAFVGGAVLLQVPLVALPAVFLALGFRSTLLAARLAHGVREAGDGSDRAIAAAAFDWLRQHGGAQLSFAQRLNAVEAYRTSRTVRARSGLQLTGTALAYAAALAIGPATWFALATTRGFDPNEAAACVPAE